MMHLIFEQGEVGFAFYLFEGGPTWQGSDRCVRSDASSQNLMTASGLRLGQPPAQVMAILGKPTAQHGNEFTYSFLAKKKNSEQDRKKARQEHPELRERDFDESYEYYYLGASISAKFSDSKLRYLVVSKSETN